VKITALICYGLLGLPLAMAALPVYVQIPNYYTTQLGLPLAGTGLMLFFARLIDTVQDPFLGKVIDKIKSDNPYWLVASGLLLCAAFYGLWLPPDYIRQEEFRLLLWLGLMLILAYTAHSMLNIAYLTWGAGFRTPTNETTLDEKNASLLDAAAWREGFGLSGVILASILPAWILQTPEDLRHDHLWQYSLGFGLILMLSIWTLASAAPKPLHHQLQAKINLRQMLAAPTFRRLASVYFFNSLSVAIPATLLLFFINDQIRTPEKTGLYLAGYFIAGACGLPLWIKFARRYTTRFAWQVSMLLAVCSFIGAAFLGAGDSTAFLIVCIVSGLVLGADLALPPVLLAENVSEKSSLGSYYGIWSLISKLSLALAGLSLPLLHLLGFQSSFQSAQNTMNNQPQLALIVTYALIPCLCKLIAFQLLRKSRS
jgi:GPH family glycoside/pentoside/hexuronide:cation symporter